MVTISYSMCWLASLLLLWGSLAVAAETTQTEAPKAGDNDTQGISTYSHHYLRKGKGYFYHKENGGFEKLTGIPFSKLACKDCHSKTKKLANGTPVPKPYAPSCADCHDLSRGTNIDSPAVCLNCHTRQRSEVGFFNKLPEPKNLAYQDVHVRNGMTCTSCHTGEHLHQDARGQLSMLSPGGIDARCENCHNPRTLSQGLHHTAHGDNVACATCHIESVFTCTNCHFDTEVAVHGRFKRVINKPRGFTMLANRKGSGPNGKDQIYPTTFMSMVHEGKTFYTLAPMFSHTTIKNGKPCKACHNNERIQEYQRTGEIVLTEWNEKTKTLDTVKGVVPIPENWSQVFKVDFAEFTGDISKPGQLDKWIFLKHGADLTQMLEEFATPLTAEQMNKLSMPITTPAEK